MNVYFDSTFSVLFITFSFLLSVLSQGLSSEGLPRTIHCDLHSICELKCNASGRHWRWLKEGRQMSVPDLTWDAHDDGRTLISSAVQTGDAGNYTCIAQNQFDLAEFHTRLLVKTPPCRLANVSIHASTVIATLRWQVHEDGGYPVSHFTLVYKPVLSNVTETWSIPVPLHISPAARQFFVYHLKPNTGYLFRLWASNQLGPGVPTTLQATTSGATDPYDAAQRLVQVAEAEDFSSSAWVIAVSMVMGTVLVLSCLSCILIYKEGRNNLHTDEDEDALLHIITNPGFDLEECRLLDHVDCNCNSEQPVARLNNNTVVLPSRV